MSKKSKYFSLVPMVLVGLLASCGYQRIPIVDLPVIDEIKEPDFVNATYKDFSNVDLITVTKSEALDVFSRFQTNIRSYKGKFIERYTTYNFNNNTAYKKIVFDINFDFDGFKTLRKSTRDDEPHCNKYFLYNFYEGSTCKMITEARSKSMANYTKEEYEPNPYGINYPILSTNWFYDNLYSGINYQDYMHSLFLSQFDTYTTEFYKVADSSIYKIVYKDGAYNLGMYFDENFIYQGERYYCNIDGYDSKAIRQFGKSDTFESDYCNGMIERCNNVLKNKESFSYDRVDNFRLFNQCKFEPTTKEEAEPVIINAFDNMKNTKKDIHILKGMNKEFEHTIIQPLTKSFFNCRADNFSLYANSNGDYTCYNLESHDNVYKKSLAFVPNELINDLYFPTTYYFPYTSYKQFLYWMAMVNDSYEKNWYKDSSTNIYKLSYDDGSFITDCYFDSNLIYEIRDSTMCWCTKINYLPNAYNKLATRFKPLFSNLTPYVYQ